MLHSVYTVVGLQDGCCFLEKVVLYVGLLVMDYCA